MKDHNSIGHIRYGHGNKKVIVLHSWMDDAESWNTCKPFMNPNAYTYVFMDVRGYGQSKEMEGQYNLQEITNDIFQLAEDLSFQGFSLIGHSMCGMAAQYATLKDDKKRIEKVVLITPVSSSGFPADDNTKKFLQSIVQNVEVAKMGYGAFTSNRHSDYWCTARAQRHVEVTNKKAQLSYMDMWLNENFKNQMKKVPHSFLIISGQYDHPMFTLEVQKKNFEGFNNVEYVECENSGHFPMQETPVYLASVIEAFLN